MRESTARESIARAARESVACSLLLLRLVDQEDGQKAVDAQSELLVSKDMCTATMANLQ